MVGVFQALRKKEGKKYVQRKIDTLPVSRFARSAAEKCKNVTKHKKCNKIETNTCFILELLLSLQKFETRNSQIRNSAGRRSTTSSLIERVISCEINISVTRYTRGRCCIVRVIGESYSIVDAIASVN